MIKLIKAEDSGGLFNTATVNIKVTDINDKNPEFVSLPYEFAVKEGEARKLIGRVHAEDADEGVNAEPRNNIRKHDTGLTGTMHYDIFRSITRLQTVLLHSIHCKYQFRILEYIIFVYTN